MRNQFLCLSVCLSVVFAGCGYLVSPSSKFSGTLEMTEHSVGARVPGRLSTRTVKEGDRVSKGSMLGTLDRYDQVKKDYERLRNIFKTGGSTEQALEHASLDLQDQQIVSPVDGIVLLKVRETGEVLPAGGPVLVIGDTGNLWVRVYVPEGMINRVHLNDRATVKFDGLGEKFEAHVSFISPKAEFTPRNVQTKEERVTQTFAVKVQLENPGAFLRTGVSADVEIHLKG